MCLTLEKNAKSQIATEDIICYKKNTVRKSI